MFSKEIEYVDIGIYKFKFIYLFNLIYLNLLN